MVQEFLQRRREPRRWVQWPAVRTWHDQLRNSSKLILLQLREKLLKNSVSVILWSFGIGSNLERWKSWISGYLMSYPQIKKNHFGVPLFLIIQNNEPFLHWVVVRWKMCFIWQPKDQLSDWTKKLQTLPKAKLAPKQGHDHCLVPCCLSNHCSFLNPGKTITSRCMLRRSMGRTGNCSHLQPASVTDRAQFSTTSPHHVWHNQHFKSWTNWATKFNLIHHIHLTSCQPTTTSSSISATFCGENASTFSRRQKMLSKRSSNLRAWVFMLQE